MQKKMLVVFDVKMQNMYIKMQKLSETYFHVKSDTWIFLQYVYYILIIH